jgi:RNA polymerase sigma factor (sigma-70 family)
VASVSGEELVRRARDGDPEAVAALYERYRPEIEAFLRLRTAASADAEDLAQQTFVRVLGALDRVDPSRPFNAWLFHIAKNLLRDYYRTRHPASSLDGLDHVTAGASAEDEAVSRLLDGDLEAAIASLPARQRWIVRMRFIDDRTPGEIAEALGTTEQAVRQAQARAIRTLRARLDPARVRRAG